MSTHHSRGRRKRVSGEAKQNASKDVGCGQVRCYKCWGSRNLDLSAGV